MSERGIPREQCRIFSSGENIGYVTSGTFSPSFRKGIGMGYVNTGLHEVGTVIDIGIRGKKYKAKIVKRPFYSFHKKLLS